MATEEAGISAVAFPAYDEGAVSAVAVSAEAGDWEVSEEGLVSVAAAAGVALADQEEMLDMAEMVVLEAVDQEAAAMELALEASSVDREVVDMAPEAADTAVGHSVDAQEG